jgi:hypothetical protein
MTAAFGSTSLSMAPGSLKTKLLCLTSGWGRVGLFVVVIRAYYLRARFSVEKSKDRLGSEMIEIPKAKIPSVE